MQSVAQFILQQFYLSSGNPSNLCIAQKHTSLSQYYLY